MVVANQDVIMAQDHFALDLADRVPHSMPLFVIYLHSVHSEMNKSSQVRVVISRVMNLVGDQALCLKVLVVFIVRDHVYND